MIATLVLLVLNITIVVCGMVLIAYADNRPERARAGMLGVAMIVLGTMLLLFAE